MSNELTVQGVMQILKRRRTIIFRAMVLCLLLGIVACIFLKPRYRAIGEIEVQKSATDGLNLESKASRADAPADALDASIVLQTQAQVLASDSLALKIIGDLNLESTADLKPSFSPMGWVLGLFTGPFTPSGTPDPPHVALADAPHRREQAVKAFQRRLKITAESGTRLIRIQYTSTKPEIAAAVVNDAAKSLVDYTLQNRFEATNQVSNWLGGQLGDIKQQAETSQAKVERLQRESGIYSLGISDAQGKEMAYSSSLDRLQQATQELSTATSNRILKGALYKTVQNGNAELISGLAGSSLATTSASVNNSFALLQGLRSQQSLLAASIAADYSKYGPDNPKLTDERASLSSVNEQIASEVSRIGARAANDYKAAQAVEDKMRDSYNTERKAADKLNDKASELLIAREEASEARRLYEMLFSHLKEAGVIEGLRSSNISVIDPGRVPSKPLPDALTVLALSLLGGCFLGIAGAILTEAMSDRVEGLATIENALKARILAVLPLIQPTNTRRKLLSGSGQDSDAGGLTLLDAPNSAYIEALRGLRSSLLARKGKSPRTILITSAAEQEGKSTISLNLATVLALNGSRVLLVDADLRSAGLTRYMGLEREASGLSDALSNSIDPLICTPFPKLPSLSAIPAGPRPTYPAELLGSDRMEELVREWNESYDYVLIDSPPVLAVTDAVLLGRLTDRALLVARYGQSALPSLERAYQIVQDSEGRRPDILLNGVNRSSASSAEFYGYTGTKYYREA